MADEDVLDEAYERLHVTGPEFEGGDANHGPMAADALIRLGRPGEVGGWLDGYTRRLHPAPRTRWVINDADWRESLGDRSRLGDWLALFARHMRESPWEEVLARWWARLLPGAIASATHGLIRTGHAVRALREYETSRRRDELAQALGYWAARWQPLPGQQPPEGAVEVGAALDAIPIVGAVGSAGSRVALLGAAPSWSPALRRLAPVTAPAAVPAALDLLVDAAVTRYERWAHGSPVMLVHAATAPRAAALVLPALSANCGSPPMTPHGRYRRRSPPPTVRTGRRQLRPTANGMR